MPKGVCAVDVGTGSARAAVFDLQGLLLGRGEATIAMRRPRQDHAEHDADQIWTAVTEAVRTAVEASGLDGGAIGGLAFDATCSTVIRSADGSALPLSTDGGGWDTIAWLDHRALAEADEVTATGHRLLDRTGGSMSPEMQIPKLLWLKRHRPDIWNKAGYIADLSDFLAFRACGARRRSASTLACKWGYAPDLDQAWPNDLLARLDLGDLGERAGLGETPAEPGAALGMLSPGNAAAMGLTPACRVGAGMVDAYAGALGALGHLAAREMDDSAALVAGTSSCVMVVAEKPVARHAVWGPYPFGIGESCWISEAGQSATGALLEHVIRLHGLDPSAALHERIAARIGALRQAEGVDFACRLHVLPDFHGNRAPFGDAHALGVVHGLPLDSSFDAMCRLYWRTCVAIALGVRHILDTLAAQGRAIRTLHVAGGHLKSPLLMELYADALDCRIVQPGGPEPILLGTAMMAAVAAGAYADLSTAARHMSGPGTIRASNPAMKTAYDRDYAIFLEMQRQRQAIEAMARPG